MDWVIPKNDRPASDSKYKPRRAYLHSGSPMGLVSLRCYNGSFRRTMMRKSSVIAAYRQTWLESGSVDLTPARRKGLDNEFRNYERQTQALWRDGTNYYGQGAQHSAILFDLIAQEYQRALAITRKVDESDMRGAKDLAEESPSVFDQLNELLTLGNLLVKISTSNDYTEILTLHQNANEPFSISQMSDGERNAVLIAAQVLTVESGTVLLIDEPERHLHRSITEPFLSALFEQRRDCMFVVSTHELALPIAQSGSSNYNNSFLPVEWQ